ncbi:hypothetical protein JXC34_05320 [Candidatus Woesearchaeota archaeon]|nr:hypothetical protein [Candidatus Woesearchaeota archaeon]
MKKQSLENLKVWLIYVFLGLLVILQTTSRVFTDPIAQMLDSYWISTGLIPYIDFFEHHLLLENYILSTVFLITGQSAAAILVFAFLSVLGVFFCAFLVYSIAKRERFKNPHAASWVFLAGYTGLTMSFLRYDFWAILFALLFFWFRKPFLKGATLFLLFTVNPVTVLGSLALGAYYTIRYFLKSRKKLYAFISGGFLSMILWWLIHIKIPLTTIYYYVFEINNIMAGDFKNGIMEIIFFSAFFIIPLIVFGGYFIWKTRKKEFSSTALLFISAILLQVFVMNLKYGFFTRVKMPALVPVLAILTIFIACYSKKYSNAIFIGYLILTLFVYTPTLTFPLFRWYDTAALLDSCIDTNAQPFHNNEGSIVAPRTDIGPVVPLFRKPAEYYWFMHNILEKSGFSTSGQKKPENPITLCGYTMDLSDFKCSEEIRTELTESCLEIPSIWPISLSSRVMSKASEQKRLLFEKYFT